MKFAAIPGFIDFLAEQPSGPHATNPWDRNDPFAEVRRENLRLYLQQHRSRGTRMMLVGEAPGYLGCRLTGIPFTSEAILLRGVPELGLLGAAQGFRKSAESERVHNEQSSTIVWSTFQQLGIAPVLWAAFPFHPHKPENLRSNRAPRKPEIDFGRPILLALAKLLEIERFVAVGNVGSATMTAAGIAATKVRHPAQGGKNDFVAGLKELVESGYFLPESRFECDIQAEKTRVK